MRRSLRETPRGRGASLLVALLAVAALTASLTATLARPARAQLDDGATISTQGTQFVKPEKPAEPAPPRTSPPATPPQQAPAGAIQPSAPPPSAPAEPPRYSSVVILLDTSDSMLNTLPGSTRTQLDEAKAALAQVLSGMSVETRVQIWTFNVQIQPLLLPGVAPGQFVQVGQGGNRQALIQRLKGIRTGGGTNLFQSVVRSLGFFAHPADQALYRSGQRYPALVVVSDGEDSGNTREDLQAVLAARRRFPLVTVSAIGFKVSRQEAWFETLCRIATRPEGCATADDEAQLRQVLDSFYRPPARR
jgi:hypothetical protein